MNIQVYSGGFIYLDNFGNQFSQQYFFSTSSYFHSYFAFYFIPSTDAGPCSLKEVFFPLKENSSSGIGSCYYINHAGKVRFHEANSICMDSSSRGSLRSPFNRRDSEDGFVMSVLNFLHLTSSTTLR